MAEKVDRILALETTKKVGEKVVLKGWVHTIRDHGSITFLDLRDRSGIVQCLGQDLPKVSSESAVEILGEVKKRPPKLVNGNIKTGEIEVQIAELKLLSKSEELPLDMGSQNLDVTLPILLDFRSLTLKHPKINSIFKVQAEIARSFRDAAEKLGCVEVFTPTIAASATEGGSEVFGIDYYGHNAYLVQSPQLYKQIAVGAFERVYLFSHAYRAEPSVTTRHLSEVVQLDCEIAFIKDFDELLDALEFVGVNALVGAAKACREELKSFGVKEPKVGDSVPRLKLKEAQAIIEKRTGRDLSREPDLNPEDEIEICNWARHEKGSDFVTITHFPTHKRAFYTLPDPKNPEYSLSYDLLFRGLEISSGSQRINELDKLLSAMKDRKLDPKNFGMYLQAFKFGMPPEGGFSFGIERLTMKLLELGNVREASLFPRDMERVDTRLKK
ncbi:aspartate--tRNA(Asn) ligase [Candidatus Woesebacteria bacterium GWB1_43_5]|uniref:Aspartate--tRNA(Asn) ligase n=1 Tax=Candidatus Woesebacteria bacterium GWB1_43_5 TaxID=1802474 RepID=A0A1F7WSU9_9BACT|nr:MAG: aspartate--tRNA(Asn) ligase [Candidatus Woesebacteria bacterium GWB1_43_5]